MPRTELVHDITVVLGTLVLVVDDQANRGAGGLAFENARQDLHRIVLTALGGMPRGTRFTPVQISLQIVLAQFQARRTAIHDAADRRAVALTKASHYK